MPLSDEPHEKAVLAEPAPVWPDEVAAGLPSSSDEEFQAPRLRIIHLLAWMTAAAMMMSFWNLTTSSQSSGSDAAWMFGAIEKVGQVLSPMILSAGIVGVWVLLSAGVWRGKAVLQPGHWLLVLLAVHTPLFVISRLVFQFVQRPDGLSSWNVIYLTLAVSPLVPAAVLMLATLRCRRAMWRFVFGLECMRLTLSSLPYLAMMASVLLWRAEPSYAFQFWSSFLSLTVLGGCSLLLLGCVVLMDFRRWREGDWLHWTGVAGYSAGALFSVAVSILVVH